MTTKSTPAAVRWLARAKAQYTPARYARLMYHVKDVCAGVRRTKRLCMRALVRLWAEEGLPDLPVT